jgi:hypothetical protein
MRNTDVVRQSRAELLSELVSAGAQVRGNSVKCIFHEDQHASASIHQGDDGAWRLTCHVPTCGFSGDIFDIRAKVERKPLVEVLKAENGTSSTDPSPAPKRVFPSVEAVISSVSSLGKVEAAHQYTNPDTGEVECVQIRYFDTHEQRKKFLPHRAEGGGFVLGGPPKPWPIYNRARVKAAPTIVVVEGEKCVHAMHDIGVVATTSLSGSGNADKADWSLLAGKTVYIWPDNDPAGTTYAKAVIQKLDELNPKPTVYLLDVSGLGLPEKGDVVDYLEKEGAAGDIWHVLNDGSALVGSGTELQKRITDTISGRWQSYPMPWRELSRAAKPLFPGSITVVCGDPAASKSFFLLEAMYWWHSQKIPVALYELEEDRAFHLMRLLAMLAGSWNVLDDEWGRTNPAILQEFYNTYKTEIESFAPFLFAAPMGQLDYDAILKWIEQQCKAGAKIIGVDPITAIHTGESRQIEDLQFIVKASRILLDYEARLILVTHPRGSTGMRRGATSQDDVAGGRAFSRHTQTVLWIHRHHPVKDCVCKCAVGQMSVKCNRSIMIAKTRNGPANGWSIGFNMDPTVHFAEQGIIVKQYTEAE